MFMPEKVIPIVTSFPWKLDFESCMYSLGSSLQASFTLLMLNHIIHL